MELAFLTSAVRRYFWLIALGVVLGAMPGLLLSRSDEVRYESRAVLLVAPPSQSQSVVTFSGDPDRYVAGELSVLESLSDRVAEEVDGVTARELSASVRFEQQPLTDVVIIVAEASTPEKAQEIAASYVEVYFEVLRDQLDGTQDPALAAVEEDLEEIRSQLQDVDSDIAEALATYVGRDSVPTIEQVAPGLASDKAILISRYNELQSTRNELSTGLRISSRIVRQATLSPDPLATGHRTLLAIGMAAGGFFGLLAAAVVARLSPLVLDDEQAEEILLHPLVGTMPTLTDHKAERLLDEPDAATTRFLDSLGVRIEAAGEGQSTVTVLVSGSEAGAGSTTLAATLARRLASDTTVLLVDADRRRPDLTSWFLTDAAAPRAERAGREAEDPDDEELDVLEVLDDDHVPSDPGAGPTPTSVPKLSITNVATLNRLAESDGAGRRRLDASELIAVATLYADVVVFDGGPFMDSATTVQLSRVCDAVVLALPADQKIRPLQTVAAELRTRSLVLPVWTPSGSRLRWWRGITDRKAKEPRPPEAPRRARPTGPRPRPIDH